MTRTSKTNAVITKLLAFISDYCKEMRESTELEEIMSENVPNLAKDIYL